MHLKCFQGWVQAVSDCIHGKVVKVNSFRDEHMLIAHNLFNTANDNTEVIVRKIRECTSKISKVRTGFIVNVKKVC